MLLVGAGSDYDPSFGGGFQVNYRYIFRPLCSSLSWCLPTSSIKMTSYWARWRLKPPASPLFTQPFIFERRSKKTSKLRVSGFCVGNSPWTGEFPAQMASNAENISIWCRHHSRSGHWMYICVKVPSIWQNDTWASTGGPAGLWVWNGGSIA